MFRDHLLNQLDIIVFQIDKITLLKRCPACTSANAFAAGAAVMAGLSGAPHGRFDVHRSLDEAVRLVERHRATLEQVGLGAFGAHYPAELSGGMKQRVGLVRVLMMAPEIMLMDEPFGALDTQTRNLMQELLFEVWERSRQTVPLITHDIDEALLLADVVYVMTARPGRIKQALNVDLPRPRTIEVATLPLFNDMKRAIRALIRNEAVRPSTES